MTIAFIQSRKVCDWRSVCNI